MGIPVESSFVGTGVEDLQELASPEVEHELRVDAEFISESEAAWILFPVFCEFLAQTAQCIRNRVAKFSPAASRLGNEGVKVED